MKIKPLDELTTEEECHLIDLIIDFSREYNAPVDACRVSIAKLLPHCDGFAAIENEDVIGAIGGTWYNNPFNRSLPMLGELFWYVLPMYRETSAGGRLLHKFLELGENANVIMATLDSTDDNIGKYLEAKGFIAKERSWIKWQSEPAQQS